MEPTGRALPRLRALTATIAGRQGYGGRGGFHAEDPRKRELGGASCWAQSLRASAESLSHSTELLGHTARHFDEVDDTGPPKRKVIDVHATEASSIILPPAQASQAFLESTQTPLAMLLYMLPRRPSWRPTASSTA